MQKRRNSAGSQRGLQSTKFRVAYQDLTSAVTQPTQHTARMPFSMISQEKLQHNQLRAQQLHECRTDRTLHSQIFVDQQRQFGTQDSSPGMQGGTILSSVYEPPLNPQNLHDYSHSCSRAQLDLEKYMNISYGSNAGLSPQFAQMQVDGSETSTENIPQGNKKGNLSQATGKSNHRHKVKKTNTSSNSSSRPPSSSNAAEKRRKTGRSRPPLFACPFAKHDKVRYEKVYTACTLPPGLEHKRIMEHVRRLHSAKSRGGCLWCKTQWTSSETWWQEFNAHNCPVRDAPGDYLSNPECMDPDQEERIEQLNISHLQPEERWRETYRQLFPTSLPVPDPGKYTKHLGNSRLIVVGYDYYTPTHQVDAYIPEPFPEDYPDWTTWRLDENNLNSNLEYPPGAPGPSNAGRYHPS